jgi:RND family efflux transporter MFP subunit
VNIRPLTAAAAAAALFAAGAGAAYLASHHAGSRSAAPAAAAASAPQPGGARDTVELAPEIAARAGIETAAVTSASLDAMVSVPGTVQPNAYRQIKVTPLVAGRVTRMLVELGQPVARGAPIAEIYSPDVAEARARYLSMKADAEAGEARLTRTDRLAALGSASQQELEEVRAEHVRHQTETREAADRLRLFGIDPATVGDPHAQGASVLVVRSPAAGVVTERAATAGSAADASTPLATISEMSPVWIIGDVYERDIAAVAVNTPATVTADAYAGTDWHGKVSYVSPEVRPETRTAQVRVEITNPDAKLKFGMFVHVAIAARGTPRLVIPASAVQTIGPDTVVFVPAAGGRYRERRVTLGTRDGDRVAVLDGVSRGERVVTAGSFDLRAEAERQGVRPGAAVAVQQVSVSITSHGFVPASLTLQPGVPARITFTRQTDQTCATELSIPRYGIRRELPLDQPITVEFTPAAGDAAFQCGMGMLTGTMVVR